MTNFQKFVLDSASQVLDQMAADEMTEESVKSDAAGLATGLRQLTQLTEGDQPDGGN
jgi:hypothetical protein